MAINSLSADNRPSAMSTPTRTPIGNVKTEYVGKRREEKDADGRPGSRMAHHEVHQAHELRHEKYEREYAQAQEGVGEHLAANVPVN